MASNWLKLLALTGLILLLPCQALAAETLIYFPPEWKGKGPQAKAIAEALGKASSLALEPRIVNSYPQIIEDFAKAQPILLYAGSFVQAMLLERGLSVPISQGIDGKEFYTSILIAPEAAGTDPVAIVTAAEAMVAYSKGSSSGESGAKAATGGKAAIGTTTHQLAVNAIEAGQAKGAFVKNWWWQGNKDKFPKLKAFDYPGVSDYKNPDNVLSANKSVSAEDVGKIKGAVMNLAEAFGVKSIQEFDPATLKPSIDLMVKGKIDPKTYKW